MWKNSKFLLLLSIISISTAVAEEPTEDDVNRMEKIAFTCKRMPTLTFPLPDYEDIKMHNFKSYSKRIKDALSELKKSNPEIENSTYNVNGKAFNALLSPCLNLIHTTEEKIKPKKSVVKKEAVPKPSAPPTSNTVVTSKKPLQEASKISTEITTQTIASPKKPNQKAQSLLKKAFMLCDTAKHLKEKGELSEKKISLLYDPYHRAIEQAKEEDSLVKRWKKERIAECNQLIAKQHLDIKKRKKEAKALAKANEHKAQQEREALEKKENEAYAKAEEEDFQRRLKRAKSLGYQNLEKGIGIFLSKLKHNDISMSSAKSYLILKKYKDRFKVSSIVGELVIYAYVDDDFDDYRVKQIAVAKVADKFYEEDSSLPAGYYAFTGIREFTTILGATKQIAIFKVVEEFHR